MSNKDVANYIKILQNQDDLPDYEPPVLTPEELLGLTFLKEQENGDVIHAKVEKQVMDKDAKNHKNIKFLLNLGDGELEELITYNELSNLIERQCQREVEDPNGCYHAMRGIVKHEGPLKPDHPRYFGSAYNVYVHWESGECTWEPLGIICKDDPITCAQYAKTHGLLEKPGWKRLKKYVQRHKKFQRMINKNKKAI